jgi:hypothetical protein
VGVASGIWFSALARVYLDGALRDRHLG